MSAPQLTVYVDGQGTLSGDGLNTFQSTCDSAADLRAFIGIQGIQVFMRGTAAPNDGGQGIFYWNSGSTAPDDNGVTTIVPSGSGSGAWTRLNFPVRGARTQSIVPIDPPATTSTTLVMAGLGERITPVTSGQILAIIIGSIQSSNATAVAQAQLYYGTGPSPGNGTAVVGQDITGLITSQKTNANFEAPFSLSAYVGGLAVGTSYWFDIAFDVSGGGTTQLKNLTVTLIEL